MNQKLKKIALSLTISVGILATCPTPADAATLSSGTQNGGQAITISAYATSTANQLIQFGLKYRGTPYEMGSNRNTTTTFDCSDFVRYCYKQVTGKVLPMDSRKQATYVKNYGHHLTTNWKNLHKGDLMFFKSPKTGKVYHVGLYMGNGKILHTYSVKSRGVRVDTIAGTWLARNFYFGGSIL